MKLTKVFKKIFSCSTVQENLRSLHKVSEPSLLDRMWLAPNDAKARSSDSYLFRSHLYWRLDAKKFFRVLFEVAQDMLVRSFEKIIK